MKKKYTFMVLSLVLFSFKTYSQSITKISGSPVSDTVCPVGDTFYEVSVPNSLVSCQIVWSVTNGTRTVNPNDPKKVKVVWHDTPGATGTLTATFTNCINGDLNGSTASRSELILSVKNQAWGSYGNSINIDYCTKAQLMVTVPRMYVQGTGGIAQPPLTEAAYDWTIPAGWREVGTNRTGSFGTPVNFIYIEPIQCSRPGLVTVKGVLNGTLCGQAAPSATATISLNGINPVLTVGPEPGFTGIKACDTTPVTFAATLNAALGCISSYSWVFPASWTEVSRNANTITLRPTGTPVDSDNIRATVNFTCGSNVTSANYKPPYIPPTVVGPNIICSSATFTISNSSASSVNWSSSNTNILTINQSGLASRVSNHRGPVTITAGFNCPAPPVSKTIWVGQPTITNQIIFTPPVHQFYGVNPITLNPAAHYYFYFTNDEYQPVPGATDYTWYPPNGFSLFSSNGYYTSIIQTSSQSGSYELFCVASNACGSGGARALTIIVSSGGGGGGIILITAPNPSTDEFTVWIEDDKADKQPEMFDDFITSKNGYQEVNYIMYDELGREVLRKSSKELKTTIDVRDIKEGTYFLKAKVEDKVYTQRLLIRK